MEIEEDDRKSINKIVIKLTCVLKVNTVDDELDVNISGDLRANVVPKIKNTQQIYSRTRIVKQNRRELNGKEKLTGHENGNKEREIYNFQGQTLQESRART